MAAAGTTMRRSSSSSSNEKIGDVMDQVKDYMRTSVGDYLDKMSDAEFENLRTAARKAIEQPATSLGAEFSHFYNVLDQPTASHKVYGSGAGLSSSSGGLFGSSSSSASSSGEVDAANAVQYQAPRGKSINQCHWQIQKAKLRALSQISRKDLVREWHAFFPATCQGERAG